MPLLLGMGSEVDPRLVTTPFVPYWKQQQIKTKEKK